MLQPVAYLQPLGCSNEPSLCRAEISPVLEEERWSCINKSMCVAGEGNEEWSCSTSHNSSQLSVQQGKQQDQKQAVFTLCMHAQKFSYRNSFHFTVSLLRYADC